MNNEDGWMELTPHRVSMDKWLCRGQFISVEAVVFPGGSHGGGVGHRTEARMENTTSSYELGGHRVQFVLAEFVGGQSM